MSARHSPAGARPARRSAAPGRLACVLALALVLAGARSPCAAPLAIGVRGGSSVPDLRDNGGNALSSGWSSRLAPWAGAWAERDVTPRFALQAELDLAPQGGKRDGLQAITTDLPGLPPGQTVYARFKNVAKLDYLEIPVLAKWRFGPGGRLAALAGPFVGILLVAQNESSGQSPIYADPGGTQPIAPSQNLDANTDVKSSIRPFNWGAQAGLSAAHPLGRALVTLDVRGGLGLMNIQKNAADGRNSTGDLIVALGLSLPVGRDGR